MKTCFTYHASWTPGLHIGAARLALLNYLYALKHDGSLVLLCNDVTAPSQPFCDCMPNLLNWLGVRAKEGPYCAVHFKRRYQEVVDRLLECRMAYYDYATPEEIHAEQQAARKAKKPFLYSRLYMGRTPADCKNWEAKGRHPVIRLKMPRTDDITRREDQRVFVDLIYGQSEPCNLSAENDFVIKRTDGRFTTYLTQAVDYHIHKIDVVFRDINDRSSLAAEAFIASRAGLRQPDFGHLPYFAGPIGRRRFSPDGDDDYARDAEFCDLVEKVSNIEAKIPEYLNYGLFHPCYLRFYEKVGFLPEAVTHFLFKSLLGDSVECGSKPLTPPEMASKLDLDSIPRSIENFDTEVLMAAQWEAMRVCPIGRKAQLIENIASVVNPYDPCRDMGRDVNWIRKAFEGFAKSQSGLFLIGEVALYPKLLPHFGDSTMPPKPSSVAMGESDFFSEGCPNI